MWKIRRRYTPTLEAIGRLLCGIAPWLEGPLDAGPERELQQQYADLARAALHQATDPASPDFLNFQNGAQPVVDCGFLAQAILRAPKELWGKLDAAHAQEVWPRRCWRARGLSLPISITGLMFSATVEAAALAMMGERWDAMRVDYALREHQQWYVGDGVYGDGPTFHFDYYNSFVIQPMLLDVTHNIATHDGRWNSMSADIMKRAQRYAAIQERLISPEGTFPVVGRSIDVPLRRIPATVANCPAQATTLAGHAGSSSLRFDRRDAPDSGSSRNVRPGRLAPPWRRRPPAASRRELYLHWQPLPLRGDPSAARVGAVRPLLVVAGGRLDGETHLAR